MRLRSFSGAQPCTAAPLSPPPRWANEPCTAALLSPPCPENRESTTIHPLTPHAWLLGVLLFLYAGAAGVVGQDYYVLPRIDLPGPQVRLGEHNGLALDSFRFDSLDQLYEMAARTKLGDLQ